MQQVPIPVQQDHLQIILLATTPIVVAVSAALQLWLTNIINNENKRRLDKVADNVQEATSQAAEVANKATVASDRAFVIADKTHTLVNSQMGQQLMMYAITARTLANLTGKEEHMRAADLAEQKLKEHEAKQRSVDDKHDSD